MFAPLHNVVPVKRFVYVLRSGADPKRYYTGLTSDVQRRLEVHNSGGSQHTASLRPWMAYWDAPVEGYPPEHRDFARVWQKGEKIVFSRTLTGTGTRNTRVERDFDLEAVRKLKRESEHDISGGAELAGLALEADLVDECHVFLNPVIVGGGKPAFRPALRRNLELLETRRFGTGVIHLHYRIRGGTP